MRSHRIATLLLPCALVLGGCQQQGGKEATPAGETAKAAQPDKPAGTAGTEIDTSEVVATYSGKKLTSAAVIEEIERLPGPSRTYLSSPDRKKQFVENMILNDLLFAEGEKAGYANDPDVERQVADTRKRLVVQRLMREYQKPPEITDEDAKKYYDDNPTLYSTTQIRAKHILVKDEAEAKSIQEQVKKDPAKFDELAKEKSTDKTTAQRGGDLGKFGQGRMVPEFEKAAFALQPNQVSDVVKTQYGYHIIMVTERDEGERKPFDQVKEQIRATMRNRGLQEAMQVKFDALKKGANLVVDEQVLEKITPPPAAPGSMLSPHGGGH